MTIIDIGRAVRRGSAPTFALLATGMALLAGCSKAPAPAAGVASSAAPAASAAAANPAAAAAEPAATPIGNAVSGNFTGDGKQAALTEVTALNDDPFSGQPVIALVFTTKDQGGDPKAATNALFGNYGDAIIARFTPDGNVIGADVIHAGLQQQGSVSLSALSIKDFHMAGGEISGELTSGGPTDVFDHKLNVDLTFHAKAP
jgi:hypothetical protein